MKFSLPVIAAVAATGFLLSISGTANAAELPKDANTTCPIMQNEEVKPDLFVDYKGERVYLCCNKCKKRFMQDPDKYLARVHAADGKTTASKKSE